MLQMKNVFLFLFLLILSMGAQAGDVIVHVSLVDGIALTAVNTKEVDDFIKANAPNARVESVMVKTKRFGYLLKSSEIRLRKTIQEKIAAIPLEPTDQIKILIIDTHGNSFQDETNLTSIGKISETGVDSEFAEIFAPIQHRAAADLRVVLNSCSTLCGTDLAASKRAGSLLRYFGAENGVVYGATTSESYASKSILPSGKVMRSFAMFGLGFSQVMMVTQAIQDPAKFSTVSPGHHLFELVGLTFGVAAALSFAYPMLHELWTKVVSDLNLNNVGRLLEYKDGVLTNSTNISKFKDREVVYGFSPNSCAHALESVGSKPQVTE
jgi:hypothetical protein